MEKIDELKQLFKEMLIIVQEYGDSASYNAPKEILKRILSILEADATDTDKFAGVKREYNNLFSPEVRCRSFVSGEMILRREKS